MVGTINLSPRSEFNSMYPIRFKTSPLVPCLTLPRETVYIYRPSTLKICFLLSTLRVRLLHDALNNPDSLKIDEQRRVEKGNNR